MAGYSGHELRGRDHRTRDFSLATELLQRSDLVLRAGDALHVAIALSRGFGLATLDNAMAGSASLAGVVVARVIAQA